MNHTTDIPEVDNPIPNNAVRLYGQDAMDDFPVLKAFQQYIDAEQAKARKRLLALGIFFGILTGAIIAVFVVLLLNVSQRNQELNDKLVEYAMKDRAQQSAVVVQPPQDASAIMAMTTKLEELQKKLMESQVKAERDAAIAAERARIAAEEAAKPKGPTPEQLEITRLNALLAAEREKSEAKAKQEAEKAKARDEKERKRQEEIEAYRRKYYPELYGLPAKKQPTGRNRRLTLPQPAQMKTGTDSKLDDDLDVLDDEDAIDYFDDSEEDMPPSRPAEVRKRKPAKTKSRPIPEAQAKPVAPKVEPQEKSLVSATEAPYVIPVEVKGRNSSFRIPEE